MGRQAGNQSIHNHTEQLGGLVWDCDPTNPAGTDNGCKGHYCDGARDMHDVAEIIHKAVEHQKDNCDEHDNEDTGRTETDQDGTDKRDTDESRQTWSVHCAGDVDGGPTEHTL